MDPLAQNQPLVASTEQNAPLLVEPTIAQPVGTTNPPLKPGKSYKMLLFLVPVFIVIITMVFVGFYLSSLKPQVAVTPTPEPSLAPSTPAPIPTPPEKHDWKGYLGRESQLIFKYPPDIKLSEVKPSQNVAHIMLSKEASASAVMDFYSLKNATLADSLKSYVPYYNPDNTPETEFTVAGIIGRKGDSIDKNNDQQKVQYVYIEREGVIFLFVNKDYKENELFEKILKTVELTARSITEDWRTYSNSFGGYSIQYPPSWTLSTTEAATESATLAVLKRDQSENEYHNFIIQASVPTKDRRIELSASEAVDSIKSLEGWERTPILDFRSIGGAQVQVVSGVRKGAWSSYAVLWFRNILVEVSWQDTLIRQEQDTFDNILGSFKFR